MPKPAAPVSDKTAGFRDRLKACRTLPSLPGVAMEILDLSQADDLGTAEVAAVIKKDPALTAKLLKTANSAYFNSGAEVTTVDRAVAMAGINVSMSLALSFSFVRSMQNCRTEGFDHQAYWRRSALTAVAARTIAQVEGRWPQPDELFVPGLLADIGMLGLSEAAPRQYHPLVRAAEGDHERLLGMEREALEMDHAQAGGWMLERWKLPRTFWTAVLLSHTAEPCSDAELEPLVRTVWLAGLVADVWCCQDTARAAAAAREGWVTRFGQPADAFSRVLDGVAADLAAVTASLEIEIEGQDEIDRLLDSARDALVTINLRSQIETEEMRQRASTDALTGLANRRAFDDELRCRYELARDRGRALSIVMVDIDHFKRINDTYGHAAGDQVLAWVAERLRAAVRGSDLVARYGGEEFVAILDGAREDAARAIAERMRASVEAARCPLPETDPVAVTVSAGCTTIELDRASPSIMSLLGAADRCLYAAKRGGRNRVEAETLENAA
jgi:diguanylate cyclase (GGDEF)-like protein